MLKRIDFDVNHFEANGQKYIITDMLSVERWIEYEKMMLTFSFGKDIEAINKELNTTYELLNRQKFADAAVCISNLNMSIVRNLQDRIHPALEICCLFINREDEDVTKFDNAINKLKAEDWKKEGFAMQDFFTLACNKVAGYIEVYKTISQDISEKVSELSNLTDK